MAFSSYTKIPTIERNILAATLVAANISGDSEMPREMLFST